MDLPYRSGYAPSGPPSPTHLADPAGSAHAAGGLPAEPMALPTPELRLGQPPRGGAAGAGHPGAPTLDMGSALQQPDAEEARTIRDCICPPPRDESRSLDTRRIGQNALISALAQGGCFGLAFSLNNYLRINARPLIKQLSGFFSPIVGGFSTSVAEGVVRDKVGMQPTALPSGQSTWWHDAIPSFVLLTINKAYAKSRCLPKFGPATPAGMATTALLSIVGTGLAGALGEATAQGAGGQQAQPRPDTKAIVERGVTRAATLVPMGAVNLYAARHLIANGQMPPNLGLKPLGVGVAGWAGRNKLGAWFSSRFRAQPLTAQPSSPQPSAAQLPATPLPTSHSNASPPIANQQLPSTPPSPGDPPSPTAFNFSW